MPNFVELIAAPLGQEVVINIDYIALIKPEGDLTNLYFAHGPYAKISVQGTFEEIKALICE
ncbi:hypothetical protein [Mucilaginibacter myungsuensis]|uniref:Uncharacterized protein n=1 Tax=Mucilaginibacter myungsuensis TaxID=649104 RepID=A0A929KS94_9SPHI|nr:hypothetical protein [Mucilaginibacter myungsuensis]MBE9660566.1 hypothetical protein [Mucilaginibacter myungsuensis]MDN3600610.1 hypothetical protein [Mucilaginibacter myungsuensis]